MLGGYYSGDVNGDFQYTDEDWEIIFTAISKMAKKEKYYLFYPLFDIIDENGNIFTS